MKVQIWSDVVCPFCFIGKKNFEAALEKFEHRDHIEVEWKSFELDPAAPKNTQPSMLLSLAKKYKKTPDEAQEMINQVTSSAKRAGLEVHLDKAIPTNSFDAHRLLHLAAKYKKQEPANEKLFRAFMIEGEDVSSELTLRKIGVAVGLSDTEVGAMLYTSEYETEVRKDQKEAYLLQVRGVPFFLIDKKFAVSGAQPAQHFLQALQEAWDKQRRK